MIHFEKPTGFSVDLRFVGCFVESGGQILQLLRSRSKNVEPFKWGSPAGGIIEGETTELAMVRELREETGLSVFPRQLEEIGSVFVSYPKFSFEYFVFKLRFPYKPEIVLSSEHTAYVWIDPAEAQSLDIMLDEWEVIWWACRL